MQQYILKLIKYIAFAFIILSISKLNAQSNVEVSGDRLYNDDVKKLTYIIGNVVVKQNGVIIMCDSAIRKIESATIEGFNHVYIYQPDTFTLVGGEYLRYDENTKVALVTGREVILNDASMTLVTKQLQYNMAQQIGYYTNGANILSEQNTLTSKKGYYHRRGNTFYFKDDVVLTNPQYTMKSDTLEYFSSIKTAYFYGPTKIVSGENTIVCNYGWYNTKTEKAQFSKSATIFSKENTITADSLLYDKKLGIGRGYGNIKLTDSTENIEVYGQKGLYKEKTKESLITDKPMAIQIGEGDTMLVLADTFYFINDSLKRQLHAYPNTAILQKEFQGKCDSLIYKFNDSTISLFGKPILWNDKNQITGDTIHVELKNNKINRLRVVDNAFLASEIKTKTYNQIAGRSMLNSFSENKLKSVLVEGNAESIYYLRDNETDSAQYTGVNKVACAKMLIGFDSSKVIGIKFYGNPEGKMYPIKDFVETEKFLSGLDWQIENKPKVIEFLERQKRKEIPRILKPTKVKVLTKPKAKKPKKQ